MERRCPKCHGTICRFGNREKPFLCRSCNVWYGEVEVLKPITNADRIRAMSDEELAEWLEIIRLNCATDLCGRSCPLAEVCYSNADAPKETLDWLKEEGET